MPNLEEFIYEGLSTLQYNWHPFDERPKPGKFHRLKSIFFEVECYFGISGWVSDEGLEGRKKEFEIDTKHHFAFKCPNIDIQMHSRCPVEDDEDSVSDSEGGHEEYYVDHIVIWGNTSYRSDRSKNCGF